MADPTEVTMSSRGVRRTGYVVAVVLDAAMLYVVNAHPGWKAVPFLTGSFVSVLTLVNLSIAASLVANLAYLGYDPRWFTAGCQAALSGISLAVSARLLVVFPFDFSTYSLDWALLTRMLLCVAVVGSLIGVIVGVARIDGRTVSSGSLSR